MSKRILILFAAVMLAGALNAGAQAIDSFPRTTTIQPSDLLLTQTNSTGQAGQKFTRSINWSNVLESLMDFPNWTGGSGTSGIFTNVIYVNANGASQSANGALLTNAFESDLQGVRIIVGPGDYFVEEFAVPSPSFSQDNRVIEFQPGVNLRAGSTNSAAFAMFDDSAGKRTNVHVVGRANFFQTNAPGGSGSLIYLENGSTVTFEHQNSYLTNADSTFTMGGVGNNTLTLYTHGRASTLSYDNGYFNASATNRLYVFQNEIESVGDILEVGGNAAEWGDVVFGYNKAWARNGTAGQASLMQIGGRVIVKNGVLVNERTNASIYSTSATTNGLIEGGMILMPPNGRRSVLEDNSQGTGVPFNGMTALWLKNIFIRGATNVDAFSLTNGTVNETILENVRLEPGWASTNAIRATTPSKVRIIGNLEVHPYRPFGTGITLVGTNAVSAIRNVGTLVNHGAAYFSNILNVTAGITSQGNVSGADLVASGDVSGATVTAATGIGTPAINLGNPTPSSLLMVNGNGDATNVTLGSGLSLAGTTLSASASGGTNNPILFSGGTLTLIANQTSRHKHSTNASFAFALSGASNQSSKVFAEFQNTSTNTIYATNSTGLYDAALSSNVTVIPIAGSSVLLMDAYLSVSNNWVADLRGAQYALAFTGSGVSMGTNHTTKTVTATITGGGGTNFAGIIVSNGLERTVLWTSTTNLSLSWNAANEVIWSPVGVTASLAMTGTPGNSTNAQVINLKLRLTDSGTTSVTFPTNGIDGLAPFVLTAPSTNEFALIYDGQTFRIASYQTPSTGSGQVLVVNTNPVIWNPTIGINGASNVFTFSTPSANQVLSVHASSGGITTWTNVAPTGGGNTNLAVLATGVLDATNQIKHGSVTYSNSWQIAQEGSRSSKSATAKDGSTTIDTHGLAAFVATGTAAASSGTVSNESRVIAYSAASANADAGHEVNFPHVRPGKNNRLHGTVNLISTTNQLRMWWAFSDDALTSLSDRDMPTSKNVVGLRYNSNTNSNWWFVTSNGSSATNVDTGVPLTGEHYRARISFVETVTATTTNWVAYINGLPVATNTALLPVARMKFVGGLRTFNAASKTNAFEFLNQTSEP